MKIEELRAIADAASQGPWKHRESAPAYVSQVLDWNGGIILETTHHGNMRADAEYVATFHPRLIWKMLRVIEAADILCNGRPGDYAHVAAAHEAQVERIKALGLALRELEASE